MTTTAGMSLRIPAITIRELVQTDIAHVIEIQRAAPAMSQWAAADYENLAREPGGLVLVADPHVSIVESDESNRGAGIAGFVAAHAMGPEGELQNLAVRPELRRLGVALRLMEELHRRLAKAGVEWLYLEVRTSNAAARSLYRYCGYTECHVRPNYYSNSDDGYENALVLRLELRREP